MLNPIKDIVMPLLGYKKVELKLWEVPPHMKGTFRDLVHALETKETAKTHYDFWTWVEKYCGEDIAKVKDKCYIYNKRKVQYFVGEGNSDKWNTETMKGYRWVKE